MQFCSICISWISSKSPNLCNSLLAQFSSFEDDLYFLERSRCPIQSLCLSFFLLKTLSRRKLPWQKMFFCWLLKITYNVLKHFLGLEHKNKVIENWIFFKMRFCWGNFETLNQWAPNIETQTCSWYVRGPLNPFPYFSWFLFNLFEFLFN